MNRMRGTRGNKKWNRSIKVATSTLIPHTTHHTQQLEAAKYRECFDSTLCEVCGGVGMYPPPYETAPCRSCKGVGYIRFQVVDKSQTLKQGLRLTGKTLLVRGNPFSASKLNRQQSKGNKRTDYDVDSQFSEQHDSILIDIENG